MLKHGNPCREHEAKKGHKVEQNSQRKKIGGKKQESKAKEGGVSRTKLCKNCKKRGRVKTPYPRGTTVHPKTNSTERGGGEVPSPPGMREMLQFE